MTTDQPPPPLRPVRLRDGVPPERVRRPRAGELSRDDREAYAKAHGRDWPKPATARCLTITLAQAEAAAWARITPAEILFTDPRPIYCRGCGERGTWSDDADLCRECERGEADHLALGADADREREAEYLAAIAADDSPF